jgi:hypothetical protein
MAMLTGNVERPTTRDRLIFAAILIVIGVVLGGMMLSRPAMLTGAAIVTSALAAIAAIAHRRLLLRGWILPIVLALLGWLGANANAPTAALSVAGLFSAAAVVTSLSRIVGDGLYVGWMESVEPIGWSFSCLLFAAVFFVIIAPIGLTMRALGYDPLERRFRREAESYWTERPPRTEPDRYFRQF